MPLRGVDPDGLCRRPRGRGHRCPSGPGSGPRGLRAHEEAARDTRRGHLLYLSASGAHTAFSSTGAVASAGRPRPASRQWPHSRSRLQAPHHSGPSTRLCQPCNEKSPVTGRAGPGSAPPALSRGSSPPAPGLDGAPSAVRPWPPAPALGPASVQRPAPLSPRGPPLFSLWDRLSSAIHSNTGGRPAAGPGPGDRGNLPLPSAPGSPELSGAWDRQGGSRQGLRVSLGWPRPPATPRPGPSGRTLASAASPFYFPPRIRPPPPPPWRPGPGSTSLPDLEPGWGRAYLVSRADAVLVGPHQVGAQQHLLQVVAVAAEDLGL